ncbi:MAG: hypothetical protein R8L53_03185 [Mariprofundales bacterium]
MKNINCPKCGRDISFTYYLKLLFQPTYPESINIKCPTCNINFINSGIIFEDLLGTIWTFFIYIIISKVLQYKIDYIVCFSMIIVITIIAVLLFSYAMYLEINSSKLQTSFLWQISQKKHVRKGVNAYWICFFLYFLVDAL